MSDKVIVHIKIQDFPPENGLHVLTEFIDPRHTTRLLDELPAIFSN